MNDFNKSLDDLRFIIELPRLYLANYFEDLKARIDLLASQRCINENADREKKKILNSNWSELINKIQIFEQECLARATHKKFSKYYNLVEEIESRMAAVVNHIELDKMIKEKIKLFEGELFLNRTILFLQKQDCKLPELFSKMVSSLTFGKLIIIKNKYCNLFDLNFLIGKSVENSLICKQTLTEETVEKIAMKESFKKIQTCNQIDEICVDYSQVYEIEFDFKRIKAINETVFTGLINLTKLSLKNNQITKLETNVFVGLYNLKKIILKQNHIRHLDSSLFRGLVNLCKIDFSYNEISKLDKRLFNGLINLVYINLKNNHLKSLDESIFYGLNFLNVVNLSHNELGYLDTTKFHGLNNKTVVYF